MNSKPSVGLSVLGLVGGIGSGKSAVAKGLAERRNVVVIDADAIGHQVLKESETKESIKKQFGQNVFNEEGEIDRSLLARRVFGTDRKSQAAREDLNRIVHPRIGDGIHKKIEEARRRAEREPGSVEGVLLDAAILLETGWGRMCDKVVFVDASDEVRQKRVQETRGWGTDDWKKREQSQLDLQAKKDASDVIIDNSDRLELAVDELEQFFASQVSSANPSCKSND